MTDVITKTPRGFERDDGSARYCYDIQGKYIGQYQPDALSEKSGAQEIWLGTYFGDKCFHELTKEQMESSVFYSEEISDIIVRITPKLDPQKLFDAFTSMGPGCLFDDFKNQEQAEGAKIVFKWVERHLDFKGLGKL